MIDFLLSDKTKICPIEVKSEGYSTHRSLDEFCTKFSSRAGNRYLVYTKDLRKDGNTILVPIYIWRVRYESNDTFMSKMTRMPLKYVSKKSVFLQTF